MVRSDQEPIISSKEDGSPQADLKTSAVITEIINRHCQEQACSEPIQDAPTTWENDDSENEMEFMIAMQRYKQSSGRMFPTWSDVLDVLKSLGYEKTVPDNG